MRCAASRELSPANSVSRVTRQQRRSPQEDKILSYAKDRRNAYGENNKSSRTAIRQRKQWVNGTYRTAVHNVLSAPTADPDAIDDAVGSIRRREWKKYRDEPLGNIVEWKVRSRGSSSQGRLREEARRRSGLR
jgi:hypothetical protein